MSQAEPCHLKEHLPSLGRTPTRHIGTAPADPVFGANELVAKINGLEFAGKNGRKYLVRARSADPMGGTSALVTVTDAQTGEKVATSMRNLGPEEYPWVYPENSAITVVPSHRGNGVAEALYRAYEQAAPAGSKIAIASTNVESTEWFAPLYEDILSTPAYQARARVGPEEAAQHLNTEFSRRLGAALSEGGGPLWGRVLQNAGWRKLRVEVRRGGTEPVFVILGEK